MYIVLIIKAFDNATSLIKQNHGSPGGGARQKAAAQAERQGQSEQQHR